MEQKNLDKKIKNEMIKGDKKIEVKVPIFYQKKKNENK